MPDHCARSAAMRRFFMALLFCGASASLSLSDEPASLRTWRDSSGNFEVQAELMDARFDKATGDTTVSLRKTDGGIVAVPLEKLCNSDRIFVQNVLRASRTARPKTPSKSSRHDATANPDGIPPGLKRMYVSPGGDDNRSGRSLREALRTPQAAVDLAAAGTVICIDAGSYPPLAIVDKQGTRAKPIVVMGLPGKAWQATFSSGKMDAGLAIVVKNSSFIELRNLRAADSQRGIELRSVSNCVVRGNLVENLGQEAVHVGRDHTVDGSQRFTGTDSEHVQVVGNTIRGTGENLATYGEGIYIGTGAFRGDHTHDIVIEHNTLTNIGAEAIELKPGTHTIQVRANKISNTHHEYNGAITIAVEGCSDVNGDYLIENNLIWDIHKVKHGVAGIAIGHGNAIIRNNIIWAVQGGIAIRIYETFANPMALDVTIANNTLYTGEGAPQIFVSGGLKPGEQNPIKARLQVTGTYTQDGSGGSQRAAAELFVGPLAADADAGSGPGSGFTQKNYQGTGADYGSIGSAPAQSPQP